MSKLYDIYVNLKRKNSDKNTLYLFKSGLFYICIAEDAQILSDFFNLKLTYLNATIKKCGFPINSLNKYSNNLLAHNYSFKIIDTESSYNNSKKYISSDMEKLLNAISKVDANDLSIKEAFEFIDTLKILVNKINVKINEKPKY